MKTIDKFYPSEDGEKRVTLADSIPNDECLSIEDLAQEFGLETLRMRQVITKAFDEKIVPKLIKKEGRRILYAPQMVEALREARDRGRLGKFRKKTMTSSLKHAALVVHVPIFDQEISETLLSKFTNEEGISKYLKTIVEESVKPILYKKRELQEKFNREMNELIRSEGLI